MGRPRTNRSNWWRGENEKIEKQAMNILEATAKTVLKQLDPKQTNFVEVGDLISEGWLTSMRYAVDGLQKWEARFCMQHMKEAFIHMKYRRFSCSRNRNHPLIHLSDNYPLIYHKSGWGMKCLDLWDFIKVKTTKRQKGIILMKWMGWRAKDTTKQAGVTSKETVRLEMVKVRKELKGEYYENYSERSCQAIQGNRI